MQTSLYHQAQIVRTLPAWSKQLNPTQAAQVMRHVRKPHLDETGNPASWYGLASIELRTALDAAMKSQADSRTQLAAALEALQGINDFCEPLLQQQLGDGIAVTQAQYRYQPFEYINTLVEPPPMDLPLAPGIQYPSVQVRPVGDPQRRSLLEAALHNFEGLEQAGELSGLERSRTDTTALEGLSLHRFVSVCRQLDLGQRYQQHLREVYDNDETQPALKAASLRAWRDELRVQTLIALMRGLLSQPGCQALLRLCDGDRAPDYAGRPMVCGALTMFGIVIHDVLLIRTDETDQQNPCIVYVPGDEERPVREYPHPQGFARDLTRRLIKTSFRKSFLRFVSQKDQPTFSRRLLEALFEEREHAGGTVLAPRAKPAMKFDESTMPAQPWSVLFEAHVERLKEDARAIVVPTAEVDATVRERRLQHWLELGLDVLNVAAMFVPALNVVALAASGYQLLGNVFHAYASWQDGDAVEAIAQVESLLVAVASTGVLIGAGVVLKTNGFIDTMERIWLDDEELLWYPDLSGYRSTRVLPPALEPNDLGQYHFEGKDHIRLDGKLYEQYQDSDGHWYVRHPTNDAAYRPRLLHNGAGAWSLAHESPLEWTDALAARRMGPLADGLDDDELLATLAATGTEEGVLQRIHLRNGSPPALLADTLARLQADHGTNRIIEAVREGKPLVAHRNFALSALTNLPGWPEDHVLKVFSGAERWGEATRYGTATQSTAMAIEIARSELEQGELATAVLSQMEAEDIDRLLGPTTSLGSRVQALQDALADRLHGQRQAIFEQIYQGHAEPLGLAEQCLARQFPGLSRSVLEELASHANNAERAQMISANGRVPLRILCEARLMQARQRLDRAIIGILYPDLATSDTVRLLEGLRVEHPQDNDKALFEIAAKDRVNAARLIGQQPIQPGFRSPLRLSDGRIGYPLSGRGTRARARTVDQRLQELYPELSGWARRNLRNRLQREGDLGEQIGRLESEHWALTSQLDTWVRQAPDLMTQHDREAARDVFLSAWRQQDGELRNTLRLENLELPELPAITARFPHITHLRLRNLQLRRLDPGFLHAFPGLNAIEVAGNHDLDTESLFLALRSRPQLREVHLINVPIQALSAEAHTTLAAMSDLRSLQMRACQLSLTDADLRLLARTPLEFLDLRSNNITLDAQMASRFQDMPHLTFLDLGHNRLGVAPDIGFMGLLRRLRLDYTGITEWPRGLTTLMSQRNFQLRFLDLDGNRITTVPDLDTLVVTPLALGVQAQPHFVEWHFNYNGLEPEASRRLGEIGVSVFEHEPEAPAQAQPVIWQAYAPPGSEHLWSELFDADGNRDLLLVLDRVSHSAEAQQNPDGLARRVWTMLQEAAADPTLRERLLEVADEFPITCGDAGADAFSALEIEVMVRDAALAGQDEGAGLAQVYRRIYRREQVNDLAQRIGSRRLIRRAALIDRLASPPDLDPLDDLDDADLLAGAVDDIEIRLALRQALAASLDYPEPSHGMLYRATAMISDSIIANVERAARALEVDDQARRAWLLRQPGWASYLKRAHASRFQAISERWSLGSDFLEECLQPTEETLVPLAPEVFEALRAVLPDLAQDAEHRPSLLPLTDGLYTTALKALQTGLLQAQDDLLDEITRNLG
ncbi:hypothetical protein G7009_20440 [Pseudomonas capeferrum]|uniref:NEL-type E3 ubiquitin ligase domain-containing protein n=1 Tax=Pseudomonas capeferrum TaxID=1495066 RepID=UPI0015E311FE|nr:NEL-type E3 ubiquitin ligase domain-containing protein [Pseudomonas capeferrum]MBA1204094.1 hypothetical protein [Pseudomonas capeferrum]